MAHTIKISIIIQQNVQIKMFVLLGTRYVTSDDLYSHSNLGSLDMIF